MAHAPAALAGRTRWVWLLLAVAVLWLPLVALLPGSLGELGSVPWWPGALRWQLLAHTLLFSTLVALVTAAVGLLGATGLWLLGGARTGRAGWWLPGLLGVPPYFHGLVWYWLWTVFADAWPPANVVVRSELGPWLIAGWIMVMAYLPLSTALCWLGLGQISQEQLASARGLAPLPVVLVRIVWPLAGPGLLASAVAVWLLSLMDFSIPSLVNIPVLSTEIFVQATTLPPPWQMLVPLWPLLLLVALVLLIAGRTVGPLAVADHQVWTPHAWTRPRVGVWPYLALLPLAVQVLLPLVMMVREVWPGTGMADTWHSATDNLRSTLWLTLGATGLALPLAWLVARHFWLHAGRYKLWLIVLLVPWLVPAPLLGLGWVRLLNHYGLGWWYDSLGLPVISMVGRILPVQILVLLVLLWRMNPTPWEAARQLAGPWRVLWRIELPLVLPALLLAGLLGIALCLCELGLAVLLAPPGHTFLMVRIYNYLHFGQSNNAMGLCLMIWLLMALLVAGMMLLARWYQHTRAALTTPTPPSV
jgi:iron(III) transport system permease protein